MKHRKGGHPLVDLRHWCDSLNGYNKMKMAEFVADPCGSCLEHYKSFHCKEHPPCVLCKGPHHVRNCPAKKTAKPLPEAIPKTDKDYTKQSAPERVGWVSDNKSEAGGLRNQFRQAIVDRLASEEKEGLAFTLLTRDEIHAGKLNPTECPPRPVTPEGGWKADSVLTTSDEEDDKDDNDFDDLRWSSWIVWTASCLSTSS